MPIDRRALVARHNVVVRQADPLSPLTVGNGEFAFTADITGLQTFPDFHDTELASRDGRSVMPIGTQAQWGFHESPNPRGWDLSDVMAPYPSVHGDVDYPVLYDLDTPPGELNPDGNPGDWLWVNPHRIDLGRLGLVIRSAPDEPPLTDVGQLSQVYQELDLWRGRLDSTFWVFGECVQVTTVVHPEADAIAVRIQSPLLRSGQLSVRLAFAYGANSFTQSTDWTVPERHSTVVVIEGDRQVRLRRQLDATACVVDVLLDGRTRWAQTAPHTFVFTTDDDELELVLRFAPKASDAPVDDVSSTLQKAAAAWAKFWSTGAALDLAGSTDPRAAELERRVVLSQFLTATQCAGSYPSQETGLVMNSWAGKFHLEMHWWHAAHFAMWGRPELLERSFSWYLTVLPVARQIAERQGYRGARWPKHVGPAGRESPNEIGPLLLWQQPHPIHLAELLRLASLKPEQVCARYGEIVEASAEFLASFLRRDADGLVHLGPPIMPAQERYDPRSVRDPAFELAYVAWAIGIAQEWRQRAGLSRHAEWDQLVRDLVPLPQEAGVYLAVDGHPTALTDHPSMLAALGVVPPSGRVDAETMARTLEQVRAEWEWPTAWGWDFPVMAMCATRLGLPEAAVDTLLMEANKNVYLPNGHNFQVANTLPLYLPGNGGLLAAVALMAVGTGHQDRPGFPDQGWTVAAEGFSPRP